MKLAAATVFAALCFASVNAFSSPALLKRSLTTSRGDDSCRTNVPLFAEPNPDDDDEEGGLDLNLEEMFDMFDAAEKDADFDETVKKVKGE